jgi:prepilin-type N-terminal cleavage/methylation domain-containing protein
MIKKGFTLVEVLVSIAILGILFTFLSKTINSTKKLNKPYIQKATQINSESKIFKILIKDFSQVIGAASIIYGKKYDIVRLRTKNSIHNIIYPFVTYYVSKKDLALIRTESLTKYDLYKKEDIYKEYIYGDILTIKTKSFKVFFQKDFFNILLRADNFNPIVLKLPKVK